ncbi:hypothetical protein MMC10_008983 [Thelotrema lepadinum]|nr:hypothetical protein [Thelotrema lepadinum]
MEGGNAHSSGDPLVKTEPFHVDASPAEELDDDIYEDAGDVDFADYSTEAFLTRIPKYLWKTWSDSNEEQDIQVGTIRVEGPLDNPQAMSLMLSPNVATNRMVPKEYNLQVTNKNSLNTFIFTEKDLPGFTNRRKAFNRQVQDESALPFSQAQPRVQFQDRTRGSRVDKFKRGQNYRKAIPKKTALTGKVATEVNCLPVENQDFWKVINERNRQDLKPVRETILLPGLGIHGSGALDPAALGPTGNLDNFIKTAAPPKAKGQDNKTARIPQNELLDMITNCFKEYRYWHLKDLRDKLRQPETYLKQTLEIVAQQVKVGTHANTWQLKRELRDLGLDGTDDQAPLESDTMLGGIPHVGEAGGLSDGDGGNVKRERGTPKADPQ